MIRKYLLPLLAIAGVFFAVRTVVTGNKPPAPAQPVTDPSHSPFETFVAGAGLVEASTENISIGTPVGNIVDEVMVKVGDKVKARDPLFRLRDSVAEAELKVRRAAVEASNAKLTRLRSLPRSEDIPPADANVREAEALVTEAKTTLADVNASLGLWEKITDPRAVSVDELDRKRFAARVAETRVKTAEAKLAATTAALDLLKAGTWAPDIKIAEADLASAEAAVKQQEAEIERRTVKAPVAGTILQVKVRPGEYAQPGPLATPLMVLGDIDRLYVRVDVDENDAWRVATEKPRPARAYVRGNPEMSADLTFVRVEPYVIPKKSLTGESTERVDTRVLQVIYSFDRGKLPVYVGQQMDVYIEAPPVVARMPAASHVAEAK